MTVKPNKKFFELLAKSIYLVYFCNLEMHYTFTHLYLVIVIDFIHEKLVRQCVKLVLFITVKYDKYTLKKSIFKHNCIQSLGVTF